MDRIKFWNKLAKNYDDEIGEDTVRITKKYLTKEDTVLDFGCARGAYTVALAGEVKEIRGIDISPSMVELAREKYTDINFRAASIFEIDEQYDVILAFSVLHLMDDVGKTIEKIDEQLKPGGRFISVTTCMKENLLLRVFGSLAKALGIIHISQFRISELEAQIRTRFSIVETERFTSHLILIVAEK